MSKTDEQNIEAQDNVENQDDKKECCCRKHCHGRRCGRVGRIFVGILVIVGVVSIAGALFGGKHCYAGPHHGKDVNISERMEHMSERLLDKVDATDEQETQIKAILKKYEPNFKDIRSEHKTHRDAFLTALQQDTVNQAELEQIRKDVSSQMNNKSIVMTNMITEVANVLTVEQRKELADGWENRRHHW
ncbi:MAG: Spy/CpxP family protein refolding chaperone [Ghiorsea sp.]